MKSTYFILFCIFSFGTIFGDDYAVSYGSKIIPTPQQESTKPFKITVTGDAVSKAKLKDSVFKGERVQYDEVDVEARAVVYYEPCYKEGAFVALEYNITRMDWNHNPFFGDHVFDTASFSIGGFTERARNWLWIGEVTLNMDAQQWDFDHYSTFDILLWGRYQYCHNIGLHAGFFAETGMKVDRVYPILGFDWKIDNTWKINAVYPMNISAEYRISRDFTLAAAARFFDARHRARKSEPLINAIWSYRATGAELALNYDPHCWVTANLHAGYQFGGVLKIANEHYKHKKRFHLESAPYFGGAVEAHF